MIIPQAQTHNKSLADIINEKHGKAKQKPFGRQMPCQLVWSVAGIQLGN